MYTGIASRYIMSEHDPTRRDTMWYAVSCCAVPRRP